MTHKTHKHLLHKHTLLLLGPGPREPWTHSLLLGPGPREPWTLSASEARPAWLAWSNLHLQLSFITQKSYDLEPARGVGPRSRPPFQHHRGAARWVFDPANANEALRVLAENNLVPTEPGDGHPPGDGHVLGSPPAASVQMVRLGKKAKSVLSGGPEAKIRSAR